MDKRFIKKYETIQVPEDNISKVLYNFVMEKPFYL